jgi:hypothetical protein
MGYAALAAVILYVVTWHAHRVRAQQFREKAARALARDAEEPPRMRGPTGPTGVTGRGVTGPTGTVGRGMTGPTVRGPTGPTGPTKGKTP